MTKTTAAVIHSVRVPLPPDAAFELFTARFGEWWPKDSHHISDTPTADGRRSGKLVRSSASADTRRTCFPTTASTSARRSGSAQANSADMTSVAITLA